MSEIPVVSSVVEMQEIDPQKSPLGYVSPTTQLIPQQAPIQVVTPPTHVDPSALGLSGLGICCFAVSFQKMQVIKGTTLLLPWGVFFGAMCQFWAAVFDWIKGNLFGGLAFFMFAHFWLAVTFGWALSNGVIPHTSTLDPKSSAFGFLGFLIFCLYMTVAAAGTTLGLFICFCFIDVLIFGLVMISFDVATLAFEYIAGVAEIIVALIAFYLAAGHIINHQFGRTILPAGAPLVKPNKQKHE